MSNLNLVYKADTFIELKNDEDLFRRLEQAGYNVEDVLFEASYMRPFSEVYEIGKIPDEVLQVTHRDLELCLAVNRGRGAIDGVLEDPSSGHFVLMYDRRQLHPFIVKTPQLPQLYGYNLENTRTYYAKNPEELAQAIIGVVKFI